MQTLREEMVCAEDAGETETTEIAACKINHVCCIDEALCISASLSDWFLCPTCMSS